VRDERQRVYRLTGIAEDITERKRAKAVLERRERYLTALVGVQRRLLAVGGERRDLYSSVLPVLGQVAAASRIHVYENLGDNLSRERATWCAPGVPPQPRPLLRYGSLSEPWQSRLVAGEILQGQTADLPAAARSFFAADTRAFLLLPLFVNGEFFGCVTFDNRRDAHTW